jgi:anaerobic selenocysteine-containing dehydrogenase
MPIHGHSGIQGGGDCGSQPDHFPGDLPVHDENARRFSNLWRHPVPSIPGLNAPEMIQAAYKRDLKFVYSIGGNLLETMPDCDFVAEALRRIPVRVHQDIALNRSMLVNAERAVLVLPSQTRYEQRGGGTSTSTERRIRFTPEIPRHPIGEALPQWEIPAIIGRKSMPNGDFLFPFHNSRSVREEMGRVMPNYKGIEKLSKEGDQLQWGGPYLYRDGFSGLPGNRARFSVLEAPNRWLANRESRMHDALASDATQEAVPLETQSQTGRGANPMFKLVELKVRRGYRLWLRFADGIQGEVDLSHLAGRGVFAAWKGRRFFANVRIENGRALVWGDGIDICVDSLYLRLTGKAAEAAFQAAQDPDLHA